MTETRDDNTDIAWMRRLAEEGGQAPMRGAATLMAAGVIYGTAGLLHWAVMADIVTVPAAAFNLLWPGATAVFLTVLAIVSLRMRDDGSVRTTANRGAGAAWAAVGWGIFALFTSLAVIGSRFADAAAVNILLSLVPSVIMVFYGLGWSVTATLQRSRPLGVLALASFLAAPLLALMAGMAVQYLAYAAALFGLMALPGFLLMRAAKA